MAPPPDSTPSYSEIPALPPHAPLTSRLLPPCHCYKEEAPLLHHFQVTVDYWLDIR